MLARPGTASFRRVSAQGSRTPSQLPCAATTRPVYPRNVSARSDRRAARETVAAYHEEQLGELVRRVQPAIERFRAGEIDAFEVDEVIFQYSRAAKELWKFCNLGQVEFAARTVREEQPGDWWDRGAIRRR